MLDHVGYQHQPLNQFAKINITIRDLIQHQTSSAKSQLGSSLQDILVFADQAGLCQRLLDFVETCAMWTPEIRCGKKCPTWINILEEIEVAIANWCKLGTAKVDGCFLVYPVYPTCFIIFLIFYVFCSPLYAGWLQDSGESSWGSSHGLKTVEQILEIPNIQESLYIYIYTIYSLYKSIL